jgi:hypothetical protein
MTPSANVNSMGKNRPSVTSCMIAPIMNAMNAPPNVQQTNRTTDRLHDVSDYSIRVVNNPIVARP